jgi:D-beta-D-heptose 7-phosphate kinase / D-beta-D-heptose 1-phosphate adenosyltransferase
MNLKEILSGFSNKRIAVIGDVMLDSYVCGEVHRINPEAPVQIVDIKNKIYEIGGAGNVAANISSLGGEAFLFGYIGDDESGKILIDKLKENGIQCYLPAISAKTTLKTRIIGNNRQLLRMDEESYSIASRKIEEEIVEHLEEFNPEVIVASDYAKGVLTESLFGEMKMLEKKIIVDPKPQNKENYFGVYLITPNLKEAKKMSGLENIDKIGEKLQNDYGCRILITQGKDGMTLFEQGKIINIPTQAKEVFDVTGAGDTVIATIALSLAYGSDLERAAFLANHAAGIVVGKAGTATVSLNELEQTIEAESGKIKTLHELKNIREDYRRKDKRVVWTNGCFDIPHVGHLDYLRKSGKLGNILIVGLNSDESVRKLKGSNRPFIPESDRAEMLSGFESVNYVTIFNDSTSENYIKALMPDVYVKGGDYSLETMDQGERKVVESYNGKIVFIPVTRDRSTTNLANCIAQKVKG